MTATFADYTSRTAALRAAEAAAPPQRHVLRRFGAALFKAFADSGRHRARIEMLAFAQRVEATQPDLARRMRRAAEFNMVD